MPQVKITDPKTGVKYTLPEGVEPTADVIRRVIEAGRKADAVPEVRLSGSQRLDNGRTLEWEATQEAEDGGALDRWQKAGPKLAAGDDWVSPEEVRLSARRWDPVTGAGERLREKLARSVSGVINGLAMAPGELGKMALDGANVFFHGGASGVNPLELNKRVGRLFVPFGPELEEAGNAALEAGGLDLAKGGAALRGALSRYWEDDPAGLLAQAAGAASIGGAAASRGARAGALRAFRTERLDFPGGADIGPRTYRKTSIEPLSGRPVAVRRPASARGAAVVGSEWRNPPAWGMSNDAWYRLMKTVENSAIDSGLSTYSARGAATAYGDILHGLDPNPAGLANLEKAMGLESLGILQSGVAGLKKLKAVSRKSGVPRPGAVTRGAIKDPGIDAADLSGWDGSALGDPAIDISNLERVQKATLSLVDLMGVPKGLKAGFDLSAPGRQGAPLTPYLLLKNPKGYVGAWSDMLRSAKPGEFLDGPGEANYAAAMQAIKDHADFGAARKSGLKLSALDGNEGGHAWSDSRPISSAVGKLPGLGMSERAFNVFMDRLRMEAFSTMRKAAGPKAGARELAELADIVNVASGYGDPMATLNEVQRIASGHAQNLEKLRKPLSSITSHGMFSARNTAARFQYLNPVRYARMSKAARKIAAEQMAAHALAVGAVMGLAMGMGATVAGPSPEGKGVTGDFGKIKIGDTRYEVTGGYARQIRLTLALGQVAAGEGTEQEKIATMRDLLAQFFRNSASPVAGAAIDTALPQFTPMGAPEGAGARALDLATPLMAKEFYEAFTQEKGGGLVGAAQVSPTMLGVGVQKYQSTIYSRRGKGSARRGANKALESRR